MTGLLEGAVTPTSYVPSAKVTFADVERMLANMIHVESSCPWWIGDLLNWSEARFGEQWSQLLAPLTQVQWDTVRRYKQVAAAYKPEQRVEGATFSQHRELMLLPPDERGRWLVRAVTQNLSVREVRRLRYEEQPDDPEKPPYPPDLLELVRQVGYDLLAAWDTDGIPMSRIIEEPARNRLIEVKITIRPLAYRPAT